MNCPECSHEILPFRDWDKLAPEDRAGIRLQVGDHCRKCYDRLRRPARTSWPLKDLIEEAEFLFVGGTGVREVAFKLGLKPESLVRQYKRAFDRGLTTRELTYGAISGR